MAARELGLPLRILVFETRFGIDYGTIYNPKRPTRHCYVRAEDEIAIIALIDGYIDGHKNGHVAEANAYSVVLLDS